MLRLVSCPSDEKIRADPGISSVRPIARSARQDTYSDSHGFYASSDYRRQPKERVFRAMYRLNAAYVHDATRTVSAQLAKAGVRLAQVLNAAFE